jgi:glycosyltransferase involved in cell wall biosynthesis
VLEGRDIVCVGFSDWDKDLRTNEQHLLTRLARHNRVLYIESLGVRRPQLAARDLRRIARRLVKGLRPLRTIDGVHVLSPLVLPLHHRAWARRINAALLPRVVLWAVRRLGFSDLLLWAFMPQAEVLLAPLAPAQVLYYVDDDHAAKKGIDGPRFRAAEERFVAAADVVLASAPELVERMRALHADVHYAPNVADTELFARALQPGPVDAAIDALARPRIVFVGAIVANKLDLELIAQLTRLRPDWSFAFVGPVGPGDPGTNVDLLRHLPNVRMLGHRPYEALPDVLRGADVAIMPYRTNGEMRSVFPMKTYEYLAAGVPVVTTPLPALASVEEVVKAADAAEMAARIDDALAADTPQARAARSAAAQSHSWEARLEQLAEVLARG